MINIEGLDKAEVLKALYDASHHQGFGVLQMKPSDLTVEEARTILDNDTYVDYCYGKNIKVDFSSDKEIDQRFYDRDCGDGAAARVIEKLRKQLD